MGRVTMMLALLVAVGVGMVSGLACSATWECASVSNDYNYVECIGGTCECRTGLGFSGLANSISKCACAAPNAVYWLGGNPYCIQYSNAVTFQQQQLRNIVLESKVRSVYDSTIWPIPTSILANLQAGTADLMATLFDANVEGRVDPVGGFDGFDAAVRYFYATLATDQIRTNKVTFTTLQAKGNQVTTKVTLAFDIYAPDLTTLVLSQNLTQSGVWTFNTDNRLTAVDLTINQIGLLNQPIDTQATRDNFCDILMYAAQCNPTDPAQEYYVDPATCADFLNSLDFGTRWLRFTPNDPQP